MLLQIKYQDELDSICKEVIKVEQIKDRLIFRRDKLPELWNELQGVNFDNLSIEELVKIYKSEYTVLNIKVK